ncbi:MAG: hypothetical protein ABIB97_01115 [Patescibacteria group bacterium]
MSQVVLFDPEEAAIHLRRAIELYEEGKHNGTDGSHAALGRFLSTVSCISPTQGSVVSAPLFNALDIVMRAVREQVTVDYPEVSFQLVQSMQLLRNALARQQKSGEVVVNLDGGEFTCGLSDLGPALQQLIEAKSGQAKITVQADGRAIHLHLERSANWFTGRLSTSDGLHIPGV